MKIPEVLEDTPQILKELATVEMHAIQTSGNCIRNITTDQFSGVTPDEIIDPRYLAEIIRQWSTFHPEFALLPRKFKIAITGSSRDRAIVQAHDIGLEIFSDEDNEMAIKVWVGGGLGRTPILGSVIKESLSWKHILTYSEAILRVYNLYGRRDNMYKARIKILVKALGIEKFKELQERENNKAHNKSHSDGLPADHKRKEEADKGGGAKEKSPIKQTDFFDKINT